MAGLFLFFFTFCLIICSVACTTQLPTFVSKESKNVYSEQQADRIRQQLSPHSFVEKKMMGGLIFMVRDAMCVGIDIDQQTQKDRLMVRVGTLQYEELLQQAGSKEMDFTGRVMRGFLFVDAEGFDLDADLDFWSERAIEFNSRLAKTS